MSGLTITVAGATGKSGGACVRALSAAGKAKIRAVARDPASDAGKALAALPNVTVVKGDYSDAASLKAALDGAQRAFLVCSVGTEQQATNEIAFIKAAQAAGVELVVRISTCLPIISLESKCIYAKCHAQIEKFIEEAKAPVVDLNPDWFQDNWAGNAAEAKAAGTASMPLGTQPKHSFINTEDIGGYAAALLQVPKDDVEKHIGKRYHIGGPVEATWADVISWISAEVGYAIKLNDISVETLEKALASVGFPPIMALSFSLTFAVMEGVNPPYRPLQLGTHPVMAALYKPAVTPQAHIKQIAPFFKKEEAKA